MKMTEVMVDGVFQKAENHEDFLIGVYKLLYGEKWDKIEKVITFPRCGEKISEVLWDRMEAMDKKFQSDLRARLLWMNMGFSTDKTLGPWTVLPGKALYVKEAV